jgi:hypothetical protein
VQTIPGGLPEEVPDRLAAWATRYLALAVVGVRSPAVKQKIALHLDRFVGFFHESYGHDRIGTCLRRDGLAWQRALVDQVLAPATVNNHLASLSAFTTWVAAQAPAVFPVGGPAKGSRMLRHSSRNLRQQLDTGPRFDNFEVHAATHARARQGGLTPSRRGHAVCLPNRYPPFQHRAATMGSRGNFLSGAI